eukprot:6958985-Pyramimonas_sp.AAC.1
MTSNVFNSYEYTQRFSVDWDNLVFECRDPLGTNIIASLFQAQIRRHPWRKQDMRDYNKIETGDPYRTYMIDFVGVSSPTLRCADSSGTKATFRTRRVVTNGSGSQPTAQVVVRSVNM